MGVTSPKTGDKRSVRVFISDLYQCIYLLLKLAVVILIVFAAAYGARKAYRFGFSVFTSGTAEAAPGQDIALTVSEDMSDREVAVYLQKKGVVKDSWVFFIQAKIYGYDILPGSYVLNSSQTVEELLTVLSTPAETEEENS